MSRPNSVRIVGYTEAILRESTSVLPVIRPQGIRTFPERCFGTARLRLYDHDYETGTP